MLIKSQSEVRLHTRRSVHFHPSQFTRPSFSIFEGLVPRLGPGDEAMENLALTLYKFDKTYFFSCCCVTNVYLQYVTKISVIKNCTDDDRNFTQFYPILPCILLWLYISELCPIFDAFLK